MGIIADMLLALTQAERGFQGQGDVPGPRQGFRAKIYG